MSILFSELIKNEITFYFEKWGDGEYYCIHDMKDKKYLNCDGDNYTNKIKNDLLETLINTEYSHNHYIGEWPYHKNIYNFYHRYKLNFVNYHKFMFLEGDYEEKINIFKNIKNSKLKKIYVCNKDLSIKLKDLLNIDTFIIVPFKNWYDEKGQYYLNLLKKELKDNKKHIILFSSGQTDHIFINKIKKYKPNNIMISIGSGFDWYCLDKKTRSQELTKEEYISYINKI